MKSIFNLIVEKIDEEHFILPEGFELPDERPEEKIKYAPGAMDGIIFYHMGVSDVSGSSELAILKEAIELASKDEIEKALEMVNEFAEGNTALSFIDPIQRYVTENESRFEANSIYKFALKLILDGTRKEAVKVGMILLELFNTQDNKDMREIVRLLGLSDEFTLYSGFIIRHWDDSDEVLFAMAKKVHGWGRIHAIRMLENATPKMAEWLIINGVSNDVMASYSALDVYEKIDFAGKIADNNLSPEEYRGLARILDALLDEGPVAGISRISGWFNIIDAFVKATVSRHDIEAEDLKVLRNILAYLKDDVEYDEQSEKLIGEIELLLASMGGCN